MGLPQYRSCVEMGLPQYRGCVEMGLPQTEMDEMLTSFPWLTVRKFTISPHGNNPEHIHTRGLAMKPSSVERLQGPD